MKRMAGLFVAALFAAVVPAMASTLGGPATGLWARPGDGGRGFNIDIQGDTMIVTTFVYEANGDSIWYLSSGLYNHDTARFQSSYDSYSNGQCFGCPPYAPDVASNAAGPMTIQFHDNQHATITTPSGAIAIEKFNYGFPSLTGMLYGEWIVSMNIGGLVTGDWLVFDQPYTGTDGVTYAAGHSDDSDRYPALGSYSSAAGGFVIVAMQDGDFVHSYILDMDDHRGIGSGWVHDIDLEPTGNGSISFSARALYESELVPLAANAPARAAGRIEQASLVAKEKSAADAAVVQEVARMRTALREYVAAARD